MKLTVFTSRSTLAKRMHPSGRWEAAANMYEGTATVTDVEGLQGLAYLIGSLDARQAIALGVIADGRQQAPITTRKALEKGTAPAGAIMRGNESFELPQSGFLFIDVDDGSEPEQVLQHLEAFLPELAGVRWLALASSRHHVTNPRGETVCRKGGWHLYAECAAGLHNLPALAKAYEAWAQANGHARQQVNAGGASVWQYPVDTSVWKGAASRLIFESVALPTGFKADRPCRWINPEGKAVQLPAPAVAQVAQPGTALLPADCANAKRSRLVAPAVEALNASTDLVAALLRYGYRHHSGNTWSTPEQSGESAGAAVYGERVHHFTNKGPFAGRSATAFDLLVQYEYSGDRDAALAATRASTALVDEEEADRRDNLAPLTLPARRAWLDWLASGDSRHLGMAALFDGVEQRTSAGRWAAERNRPELAAEILAALRAERASRWEGLHTPSTWLERQHVGNVADACAVLMSNTASTFLQAPLGAGKTEKVLRPLIAAAGPSLIINHLCTLSNELATKMEAQHYQQDDRWDLDAPLVTTVNSLAAEHVRSWIEWAEPTLVIIDEAAAVADVLGQPGGNMKDAQQLIALDVLCTLAKKGARFVLADGDVTPTARVLADLLGVSVWVTAQGEYEQPTVELHHATTTRVLDNEGRQRQQSTTPLHDAIKATQELALFCDTRTDTDAWSAILPGALALHGENAGEDAQAAFLDAPDASAFAFPKICYNSVLGAGVSVTSVERPVFAIYSGHLAPHTTWQALRRFRRVAGGVIRVQVSSGACTRKRNNPVTDAAAWQAAWQEYGGAAAVGSIAAGWQALRAAYCAMADRWQRNPAAALRAYLEEAGITVIVLIDDQGDTDTAHTLARKASKDARTEAVRTAPRIDDRALANIQRKARKTLAEAAQERRAQAERTLHLTPSDFDADGNLPAALADAITRHNLEKTARLSAYAWRVPESCDNQDKGADMKAHHLTRHRLALATFEFAGIDPYAPTDTGSAAVTVDRALELIERIDAMLPKRGRLPLLREMGLPDLPPKKASRGAVSAWLRDWLRGWGMVSAAREVVEVDGQRVKASRWKLDTYVCHFGRRISAVLDDMHGGGSNTPQSRASRGLQRGHMFDENRYPPDEHVSMFAA